MAPNRTAPSLPAPPCGRIAVIGAGRLGPALCTALRRAGVAVDGPLRRGEPPQRADAVVLCVPDAELEAAATAAAGSAPLIGHTSGATPLAALAGAGATAFGLHPLQTFVGPQSADRFSGAGCAVGADTPAALRFARELAKSLGMSPFEIADGDRAAYHAAASIASNFLVALEASAEDVACAAGIDPTRARALFAPLVRATVENWATVGPERALTGPVARGDEATVQRQRRAVAEAAPANLDLFDALVERTRALAGRELVA